MNITVLITFCLIVLARITDVSLDTIRTVSIIQGRRAFAAVLGFFEAVVYICAAAKVLLQWRGDGSTGWSYAWRMPLWARTGDGDFAFREL